jgi:hypothetical protein
MVASVICPILTANFESVLETPQPQYEESISEQNDLAKLFI